MFIGVFDEEKSQKQRVRINLIAETSSWPKAGRDVLEDTVSYDDLVGHVRREVDKGHVFLVETLAENIALACLSEPRIKKITVRVEKPDIYSFAIPGVEIIRVRS